jgi:hypothetical protein
MGFPLTGGSFLQVASEEAHLVLLPAANTVFSQENAALRAASGEATGIPLTVVALALALVTAFVLYRAQRWLARRTNRVLSPGLVLASLLLAVSMIVLATGFLTARSDLARGISHGNVAADDLAFASIGIQQIRGDAVLNVISRSGSDSFQEDFVTTSKKIGPGQGAWLGDAADYAAERSLVVGGTAAGYTALDGDMSQAIAADQAVFDSGATAGAHALDPLEGVVIAASLLMAVSCGWAVSRRLAEYR